MLGQCLHPLGGAGLTGNPKRLIAGKHAFTMIESRARLDEKRRDDLPNRPTIRGQSALPARKSRPFFVEKCIKFTKNATSDQLPNIK
jgi:hypothetical protein